MHVVRAWLGGAVSCMVPEDMERRFRSAAWARNWSGAIELREPLWANQTYAVIPEYICICTVITYVCVDVCAAGRRQCTGRLKGLHAAAQAIKRAPPSIRTNQRRLAHLGLQRILPFQSGLPHIKTLTHTLNEHQPICVGQCVSTRWAHTHTHTHTVQSHTAGGPSVIGAINCRRQSDVG